MKKEVGVGGNTLAPSTALKDDKQRMDLTGGNDEVKQWATVSDEGDKTDEDVQ